MPPIRRSSRGWDSSVRREEGLIVTSSPALRRRRFESPTVRYLAWWPVAPRPGSTQQRLGPFPPVHQRPAAPRKLHFPLFLISLARSASISKVTSLALARNLAWALTVPTVRFDLERVFRGVLLGGFDQLGPAGPFLPDRAFRPAARPGSGSWPRGLVSGLGLHNAHGFPSESAQFTFSPINHAVSEGRLQSRTTSFRVFEAPDFPQDHSVREISFNLPPPPPLSPFTLSTGDSSFPRKRRSPCRMRPRTANARPGV